MKYLEFPALENLNSLLSCIDNGESRLFGKIEAYSCKNTHSDKLLEKQILSPTSLDLKAMFPNQFSRKSLFYLLATLNASYQDNDFANVKEDSFLQVDLKSSVNEINLIFSNYQELKEIIDVSLWNTIDIIISLNESLIFKFFPTDDLDGENNLWSFYLFFYNKKMKRVLFFTCRSCSLLNLESDEYDELSMDY